MDFSKIIQAWSDPKYRESLTPEEQTLIPEHPAGFINVPDEALAKIAGGGSACDASLGCCPFFTWTCAAPTDWTCDPVTCGCAGTT